MSSSRVANFADKCGFFVLNTIQVTNLSHSGSLADPVFKSLVSRLRLFGTRIVLRVMLNGIMVIQLNWDIVLKQVTKIFY